MCLRKLTLSNSKTMILVSLVMLVSVMSGASSPNATESSAESASRMAWLQSLFDHQDWFQLLDNATALPPQCADDLRLYVTALNEGQLWASKMYDASGQYSPNVLFGSDYWLGSMHACYDLQLTRYYESTPPFKAAFHVARVNLTVDRGHLPMSRVMLLGECIPSSCGKEGLQSLLEVAEAAAAARASAGGIEASIHALGIRDVPGQYSILKDVKLHLLGSATLLVIALMLAASVYEGYLERKYRMSHPQPDAEARSNQKSLNNNVPPNGGKAASEDNSDRERRQTCGVWSELLLSFSILSNGRTILSTDRPTDGALTCLHGMRFMSVVWVIMVHTYLTVFYVADNKTMRVVTERNFLYQSVGNASYCVDTFFFISGLLVTVLFLRTEDKKKAKKSEKKQLDKQDVNKNINGYTNSALSVSVISQQSFCEDLIDKPKPKVYSKGEISGMIKSFFVLFLYRVVRLTPAYAFVIGLNEITLRYTHYHSVFESPVGDHITCDLYWWRNLLYINNLFPQREMCMVWSWYMANDTQFYVVGIILLLISVKFPKVSWGLLGLVLASSWVTTIYISVSLQYKARIQEPFEMFDALYDKPWSRIGPYLVGMMVGWYLHKTKCQVKIPYWLVAVGWPVSIAMLGSVIFGMADGYLQVWPTAFYVSVGHTGWGVALAWIAIACCTGHGGLVNSFLSYRGVLPLSRLTYCAYLIHPTIMMYTFALLDGPLHMENSIVLTMYAGYAVMSFLASFAVSIAFEAPAVRLLKIISGGTRPERRK